MEIHASQAIERSVERIHASEATFGVLTSVHRDTDRCEKYTPVRLQKNHVDLCSSSGLRTEVLILVTYRGIGWVHIHVDTDMENTCL